MLISTPTPRHPETTAIGRQVQPRRGPVGRSLWEL